MLLDIEHVKLYIHHNGNLLLEVQKAHNTNKPKAGHDEEWQTTHKRNLSFMRK